jgi:hypothetical protein
MSTSCRRRSRPPGATDAVDASATPAGATTAATHAGDLAATATRAAAAGRTARDLTATAAWAAAAGRTAWYGATAAARPTAAGRSAGCWCRRRRGRWAHAGSSRRRCCCCCRRRGGACRSTLAAAAAADRQRKHGRTAEQRDRNSWLGFHQTLAPILSSHCVKPACLYPRRRDTKRRKSCDRRLAHARGCVSG